MQTVGEFIKFVRKERGLTQDEVAQKLSVVTPVVSRWENDKSIPDLANLSKLCTVLTISIEEMNNREMENGSKFLPPENYDGQKLGRFIKKLRIKNGLSQSEVGEKLFVTGQTVSKWENGGITTLDALNEVAKFYSLSPDLLLSGVSDDQDDKAKTYSYKKPNFILAIICSVLVVTLSIFIGLFIDKAQKVEVLENKYSIIQDALEQSEQTRLEYSQKLAELLKETQK